MGLIKCRLGNEDCDKAIYTCDDCTVILDFIKECRMSGADTRNITWLGQALELLDQVTNTNTQFKTSPVTKP